MTRPRALLEELGVAGHQVGKEALGLLGEALAAPGWRGALGAAPLWPLAPRVAPAPPQPDLAYSSLEELPRVVVQRGRCLDVLATQCSCQVAALCGKGLVQARLRGCTGPGAGCAVERGWSKVRGQSRHLGEAERGVGEEVRGSEEKGFSGP